MQLLIRARLSGLLAGALVILVSGCSGRQSAERAPVGPTVFRTVTGSPPVQAAVTYEDEKGIWICRLPQGRHTMVFENGRYPRWSPDGQRIACHDDSGIWIVNVRNRAARRVAAVGKPRAVAWSCDGKAVFFTDGDALKLVELEDGSISTLLRGFRIREVSAERASHLIALTIRSTVGYRVFVLHTQSGDLRAVRRGCSASLSPDGRKVTVNGSDHHYLFLVTLRNGQVQTIHTPATALDNHHWSNHSRWIAAVSDPPEQAVFLDDLDERKVYRPEIPQGVDRPDLYVINMRPVS